MTDLETRLAHAMRPIRTRRYAVHLRSGDGSLCRTEHGRAIEVELDDAPEGVTCKRCRHLMEIL